MTQPQREEQRFDRHTVVGRVIDTIGELVDVRHVSTPEWHDDLRKTVRHVVTLPSLLQALENAGRPGVDDTGQTPGTGLFESRPAARLDPIDVLARIDREARKWADGYDIRRSTLRGFLDGLRGHSGLFDDRALRDFSAVVAKWRKLARLAVGEDPMPMTLAEPCPQCGRKNCLVIDGDHETCTAVCTKCQSFWPHDRIGLFGQMLQQSATMETLAADTP